MRVLYDASGNKNHSNSYVWQIALPLYTGNYLNYYRIYPGRGREYAAKLLSSDNKIKVTGIITDCYGVYDGIAEERGYKHALCWAHLRKYLVNAMDNAGSKSIYETCLTHAAITVWLTVLADGMKQNVIIPPGREQRKDSACIATRC